MPTETVDLTATQERNRLRTKVRLALHVLGIREVIKLASEYADARAMETVIASDIKRWRGVHRKLTNVLPD